MNNPKNLSTLYIVRHGQTQLNLKGVMQGQTDSPLTEEGENQAKLTAQTLKSVHFDAVFSSDLLRAHRTAEIIALERKIVITTTQALRERHFGQYEGRPYEEYNKDLQQLLDQLKDNTYEAYTKLEIGNAETIEQSTVRFSNFIREIAVAYINKAVLVVSHGSVIRHFLIQIGFATNDTLPPGSIQNAAMIKIESDGVEFIVKETSGINLQNSDQPR